LLPRNDVIGTQRRLLHVTDLRFEQGRGCGGQEIPPLVFQVTEGLVEGGGWQAKPPTCVSSEGGGDGGCESPPSLKLRGLYCAPTFQADSRWNGCQFHVDSMDSIWNLFG